MGVCYSRYEGEERLDDKTAIITGCNCGIGKYTAMDFYKRGCKVIMACRDENRAQSARNEIINETLGLKKTGMLVIRILDLASLKSIRNFAEQILGEEKEINILINNAGVVMTQKQMTEDGFELHFGTNHLGHFLLTLLILPRMLESTPARIVTVASTIYKCTKKINFELDLRREESCASGNYYYPWFWVALSKFRLDADPVDWDNLNGEKSYSPFKNYFLSKLANIWFTQSLAKRLKGTGVNVYVVHPGLVGTEATRHFDQLLVPGFEWFCQKIASWFLSDTSQGAATTLYCALSVKAASETGLYYEKCSNVEYEAQATDEDKAEKMWETSSRLVRIDDFDQFKLNIESHN